MKYCAMINKEPTYRNYSNDTIAVKRLKLLAIKLNGKLTDISKKYNNQWSRVRWM